MNTPTRLIKWPALWSTQSLRRAFSLVEMMACVSIIGIVAFMAIPSVTRMHSESIRKNAISKCEGLNMAKASFIQMYGRTQANAVWQAKNDQQRYDLLRPYLSFAEALFINYMPEGFSTNLSDNSLLNLSKVPLVNSTTNESIPY